MGLFTFKPAKDSVSRTTTTTTTTTTSTQQSPNKKHRHNKKKSSPSTPTPTHRKSSPSKHHHQKQTKGKHKQKQKPSPSSSKQPPPSSSSWDHFKNLLTCKQIEGSQIHDPSSKPNRKLQNNNPRGGGDGGGGGGGGSSSSCGGSMRSFRDVVHGNTRVVHRSDTSNSPETSSVGQDSGRRLLTWKSSTPPHPHPQHQHQYHGVSLQQSSGRHSTRSNTSTVARGMQLRKLSGCYECHMIVDPSRYPIIPRTTTVCSCPQCGEIFPKIESLEHHQAVKHAVSELGPEDSGRNIVEIIFKSSWMNKDSPIYKIERILKVHNTPRTIQRFEDCRDAVKARAGIKKKNPRCAADGNELLRFHCTSLGCALGDRGSSSLCGSGPACGVCTIIRHGFQGTKGGVTTTASSGRAHDSFDHTTTNRRARAMLVCRVIAGRVRRNNNNQPQQCDDDHNDDPTSCYDSMAGSVGVYEELSVFNPKAILPCFVVIYRTFDN